MPIMKRIKTKEAGEGVPKANENKSKHNKIRMIRKGILRQNRKLQSRCYK